MTLSARPDGQAAATEPLLVSDQSGVRTLTFNRPAAFNSFDMALKEATLAALTDAGADESVRAVVITGAGRAFSAGQDLKQHLELVRAKDPRLATTVRDFYNVAISAIVGMPKPVVAAVNGACSRRGRRLRVRLRPPGSGCFGVLLDGVRRCRALGRLRRKLHIAPADRRRAGFPDDAAGRKGRRG